MSDAAVAAPVVAKTKKPKAKTTKPKTASAHPPVMDMVKAAIKASKERKGTSLATIKKYIAANYKVDLVRLSPFIRKAVASGAEKGVFARVGNKGKGASGSFKIGEKASVAAKPKVKTAKKPKSPKKVAKPKVKKATTTKKTKSPKKAAKSPKKAVKPKTPKVKKSPAKKVKKVKKPAAK